jgi:Spy/CpxP family protein refolding chaperone
LVLGCNNGSSESSSATTAASAPSAKATSTSPAAASAPASSAAPSASASAEAPKPGHAHHPGGPLGTLLEAASALPLKPAQKATVEGLQKELQHEPGPSADVKSFHTALVAGVRAGKIDMTKLVPLQAAFEKDIAARHEKEAAGLSALYTALEAPQRKALVAAVRAKQAEHEAHHKAQQATPPKPGEWAKRKVERMTKELDLDATQQKAVEALLAKDENAKPGAAEAKHAEMKKQMDALLTAFEGEKFDAKKLELGPPAGKKGPDPLTQRAQFLSLLLPILKPAQREKLAASMEKPHGEHGPDADAGAYDDPSSDESSPTP